MVDKSNIGAEGGDTYPCLVKADVEAVDELDDEVNLLPEVRRPDAVTGIECEHNVCCLHTTGYFYKYTTRESQEMSNILYDR